jgi:transposase
MFAREGQVTACARVPGRGREPAQELAEFQTTVRGLLALIGERQREAHRIHTILQDTGIKLDCVASDILGASARAMLDALGQGTTGPQVPAELAKASCGRRSRR